MIRQVELSLKFLNKEKRNKLQDFYFKYLEAVKFFIDILWDSNEYKFISQESLKSCNINITARAKQCAGKQALSIINGTLKKHKQRIYRRDILKSNGEDTSRLDYLISKKPAKPVIGNIPIELDSRFISILTISNTFDLWIKLTGINNKIICPLKKTKMFNKWAAQGVLKQACRLTPYSVSLYFECEKKQVAGNKTIGIDIGINSVVTTSDGLQNKSCPHGHTMNSILKKLARKKKGSKAFNKVVAHRKNFINWTINQLNLMDCNSIVVENILNMRKGKNRGRFLSHFTYTIIFDKLERLCEEWNVSINKVNPAYTSQKCSACGEIKTENRNGEHFECKRCGYTQNADINAAKNILASV